MRQPFMFAAIGLVAPLALIVGGCTTTARSGAIDVTRYHLGTDLSRGTIRVEPASGADAVSIEYQGYLDAIRGELLQAGYADPATGVASQFVATVKLRQVPRGEVHTPSPFQIGIGGGGFSGGGGRRGGGGFGLGGDVSFPIGHGKTRTIVQSELWVQIRNRADGSAIWEGRAISQNLEEAPAGGPIPAARLASALFRGFPGDSGITITVK